MLTITFFRPGDLIEDVKNRDFWSGLILNYAHKRISVVKEDPIHYIELQAEAQRQLDALRAQTSEWLNRYHITQRALCRTINLSQTYLSDFLAGRRGLSSKSYLKLSEVVSSPADLSKLDLGSRIMHAQNRGQAVQCGDIDIDAARTEFGARRAKEINLENKNRRNLTL